PVALLAALPADHAFGRLRDWARDLPQAGGRVRAVAGAALLLVGVPGFAPTHTTVHAIGEVEDSYGAGVKEAALLVHELDPEAAQVGTLLGRFTIHFYNRQPTYHWFVDHGFVEREIEAGRVRFMVLDKHLDIARETAWMEDLAARHDARLVRTWQAWGGHDVVWLYEFPRANLNATPPATAAAATRAETEGTLPLPTNSGPWSTPTPDKAV
ncbi:MAG: hypothetical protein HYT80_03575, partial [Euryarchaeota archaeon]|nr:hypothetical protein [Euryarchaeota archaeon]